MKKAFLGSAIVLVVLIFGTFGVYKYMDSTTNAKLAEEKVTAEPDTTTEKKEEKDNTAVKAEEDQTAKIGGVTYKVDLTEESSQDEVIDVMHKMTHQKVKAEEKWGAVPMIPDTIQQVYEIVSKSDFDRKDELLSILEKWKKGQFSDVDSDHNYFWDYQDGTVGKAFGILSKEEEKKFIANNFGDDFAKKTSSPE
ncbi:DUF6241 domain-containing protein [Neobacillus mesonae]|uniref:DUF6241 domain-containing protein n=1 Tax=Neobacillus mesonae TaxID=1193713 RepID=UPI002040708E|nr:DUF6241 domain-containing protein [Neobacillus mesonae]MCM3571008.1 DUF6241 domain-containing protein [Neobacillus mesonae]